MTPSKEEFREKLLQMQKERKREKRRIYRDNAIYLRDRIKTSHAKEQIRRRNRGR